MSAARQLAAHSTCMGSSGLSAAPVHVFQRTAAVSAALLIAQAQLCHRSQWADASLQPLRIAICVTSSRMSSLVALGGDPVCG